MGRYRLVSPALKAEPSIGFERLLRSAATRAATGGNRRIRRAAAIGNLAVLAYVAGGLLPMSGSGPKWFAGMAMPVDATPWLMMLLAMSSAAASLMLLAAEPQNAPGHSNDEASSGSADHADVALKIRLTEVRAGSIDAQMIDRIGHDLRTPLTAIIGFSDMMQCEMHGPLGSDRYHSYAGHIRDSGVTLLQTIETALAITEQRRDEAASFAETGRYRQSSSAGPHS